MTSAGDPRSTPIPRECMREATYLNQAGFRIDNFDESTLEKLVPCTISQSLNS